MTDTDVFSHDAAAGEQQAAEYALGILTAPERAEAERRMASDPGFAGLVTAWDERLVPLLDAVPGRTPPRVVWMRIAAQLGLAQGGGQGGGQGQSRPGVWSSLNVWRTATGVFAVAAAASLAILVVYPKPTQTTPAVVQPAAPEATLTSVGLLKGETGPASFVVTLDAENKRLIIAPIASASPSDRTFEMWLLPEGGAPVSLGIMDGSQVATISTDKLVGPDGSRAALAVSLEPLGGSPTGQPTGPVVASGHLAPI